MTTALHKDETLVGDKPKVLILGTGTIAYPFSVLLQKALPEGAETYIAKKNPRTENVGRIERLRAEDGVKFTVWKKDHDEFAATSFRDLSYQVDASVEEIADEANLIMDCTGAAIQDWSEHLLSEHGPDQLLGVTVEGSIKEFGPYFMYGVTDRVLDLRKQRAIQLPSCNTHCLTSVVWALSDRGRELARIPQVICFIDRRNQDKGSPGKAVHTVTWEAVKDPVFGTHQAEDAYQVLKTALGEKLPSSLRMVSHATKLPQPFMHATSYAIVAEGKWDVDMVHERLASWRFIAFTDYMSMGQVYEEYVLKGLSGRGYDHAVVIANQTQVIPGPGDFSTILMATLTPQEGNVIISNLACALKFLYPDSYAERVDALIEQEHLLFGVV